jgi:hypothetical protein
MTELHDEYPPYEGEEAYAYTNRLIQEGRARGMLRQCSIGWHNECSCTLYPALAGTDCKCDCHEYNRKEPATVH